VIGTMKSLGIRVGMDDFSAGHTSFKNLRRLGFDLVKIDGAFIQNLARSPDDRFFVRTLLDLARHLNIEAVAEWVEDHETAALLAEWGVDYAQGNFFGEARPLAALTASAAA
jgi:EAL domain-containing protein (putative c-di-GMP-specific phosphodiesterase class I)